MKIELRPLAEIKPYEKNPRINDAAVDAVAESIRRFGFRQPIVVDEQNVIIVGHTRWKAAQKLGLTAVPVHVATDLTPEQIRAYRIADNKTAELAEWNLELLPIELSELKDAGIDWSLLGFDQDELAMLLDPGVKQGLTDPDDVPEPPDAAITQPADLWLLGDHRLLCGDSSKAEDVDLLLSVDPAKTIELPAGEQHLLESDGVPAYKCTILDDQVLYARRIGDHFENRRINASGALSRRRCDPRRIHPWSIRTPARPSRCLSSAKSASRTTSVGKPLTDAPSVKRNSNGPHPSNSEFRIPLTSPVPGCHTNGGACLKPVSRQAMIQTGDGIVMAMVRPQSAVGGLR